jgi:putative flippase GtrA
MRTEFLRFLLTGCANTAASWLVYLFFNWFMPYTAAYTIAYGFGMFFTYYMNTRWVFRVPMKWSTFLQFPVIFLIRYCMDICVLYLLVNSLPIPTSFSPLINKLIHPETYGPLLTILITMPIGFLMSRFVLKHRHSAS